MEILIKYRKGRKDERPKTESECRDQSRSREKREVKSGGGWVRSKICLLGSSKETTESFWVRQLYWLPARAQVGDVNVLSLPHTRQIKNMHVHVNKCRYAHAKTDVWMYCNSLPTHMHRMSATQKTRRREEESAKMSICLSCSSYTTLPVLWLKLFRALQ